MFNLIPATDKLVGRHNPVVHETCVTEVAHQFFLALAAQRVLDVDDVSTGIRQTDERFRLLLGQVQLGLMSHHTATDIGTL